MFLHCRNCVKCFFSGECDALLSYKIMPLVIKWKDVCCVIIGGRFIILYLSHRMWQRIPQRIRYGITYNLVYKSSWLSQHIDQLIIRNLVLIIRLGSVPVREILFIKIYYFKCIFNLTVTYTMEKKTFSVITTFICFFTFIAFEKWKD